MRTFHLPASPVARAVLTLARDMAPPALLNHSIRTYWHARRIADEEGALPALPDDLLFAATVLHEIGTTAKAPGRERFEIEGADIAAGALLALGADEADAQHVWDAIALHTSAGLADRRSPLARIARAGILADFQLATGAARQFQDDLHTVWPRIDVERVLVDNIIGRAQSSAALPRYGFGGVLLHERTAHGISVMEAAARTLGWCCEPSLRGAYASANGTHERAYPSGHDSAHTQPMTRQDHTPTDGAERAFDETVTPVFRREIPNIAGRSLVAEIVTYPPGGASPVHRHAPSAFIFAFVLSGAIRSQVDGQQPHTYQAGETFYEDPGSHHLVSENASTTDAASMLAVFILDSSDDSLTVADSAWLSAQ
jgi:quercetin dioxygenase-like cupin family protein